MPEYTELEVVIAGLSHYVPDYDAYCAHLPVGKKVVFVHEPQNIYTPGVAFQARIDRKMVGRVSKGHNFCLLPLVDAMGCVYGEVVYAEHKTIYAKVQVPAGICIPQNLEEALGRSAITNSVLKSVTLPLPEAEIQQTMLLADLLQTPESHPDLPQMLKEWLGYARQSISAETLQACNTLHNKFGQQADAIYQWLKDLGVEDNTVVEESWLCQLENARQVMKADGYRQHWAKVFWNTDTLMPSANELHQTHQALLQWLEQLPNQLWRLYHNSTLQLARHIMYAQFSRANLYIIISHMLALEMVEALLNEVEPKAQGTDMSQWKVAEIDPKGLFNSVSVSNLLAMQQALFMAKALIKEQGDWGLLMQQLEDDGYLCSSHSFMPFFELMALWGLVSADDAPRLADSAKKRLKIYDNASSTKSDEWKAKRAAFAQLLPKWEG